MTKEDKQMIALIACILLYIAIMEQMGHREAWAYPAMLIALVVSVGMFFSLIKDIVRQVINYKIKKGQANEQNSKKKKAESYT